MSILSKLKFCSIIIFSITFSSSIMGQSEYKIFGHRGCRGLYPENTIVGFQKAIQMGVDGIEFDIVLNKNLQIIVSHEPYVDTSYCISNLNQDHSLNIFEMSLDEIKKIDCGSKYIDRFPNQIKKKEQKPTYKELEKKLENYNGDLLFEIKCHPDYVNKYFPDYLTYAKIIDDETKDSPLLKNIIFMSFDWKILNELYKINSGSKYIFLSEKNDFMKDLDFLTFKPFALGLNYKIISKSIIDSAHDQNQLVYAWTVNSAETFKKLIEINADGIITDYPDKIKK
ncbi:glycerophosphodiester phosphodiesterase family protein [Bacteroidota bacterium]|nr:glycerophosphodiester phosphodiesterase family protein [Bacteroidota bacterium]